MSTENCILARAVADFFLLQIDTNAGDSITNLKLQKLCYYAQAWHLAIYDKPLFSEDVEAWAHGPVVPSLYRAFKKYKWECIDASEVRSNPYANLASEQITFLHDVWSVYGESSSKELEKLTHSEDPWRNAYGTRPVGSACTEKITHEDMKEFYKPRIDYTDGEDTAARSAT